MAASVLLKRHLAYRALASDRVAAVAESSIRLIRTIAGRRVAVSLIGRFGSRFVWSGWPHYVPGWTQLHAANLYWRLWNSIHRATPPGLPKRMARSRSQVLRVGCVGPFRGLLSFDRRFVERRPRHLELFVYDMDFDGAHATYLEREGVHYRRVVRADDGDDDDWASHLAAQIENDDLDLLVNINRRPGAYRLLDRVQTPCVAHICTGSELLHHPRVDFQVYAQPQAGYRQVGRRLVCDITDRSVGGLTVLPGWLLYDSRGLTDADLPTWRDRRPLIVVHGSLYKLDSPPLLAVLTRLLHEDSSRELVYMGRDRGNALQSVEAHFMREGLASRARYDGSFEPTRNADGAISDPAWARLVGHLRQARLAPNPWPVGGGSARVEAYLLGVPTVHMTLGSEEDSPHERSFVDLPALRVSGATAKSPDEYLALCRRCLTDETYATNVIDEQRAIGAQVIDPEQYWRQLERLYEDWLSTR